jgi:hypothetical protein
MAIANITGNILTDSGISTSSLLPLSGGTITGFLTSSKSITTGENGQISIIPSTNTSAAFLQVTNTDGTTYFGKNNNSGSYLGSSPNATLVYSTGSSPIMLYTNGNMIMTLTGGTPSVGGNVLINTTSDNGAKLQVSGSATFSSSVTAGASILGYTAGLSAYRTYSKVAQFEISSYQSANGSPYTKTMDIVSNADSGVPSEMRFLTAASGANPTTQMTITSGGNVGIGTTSPSQKLHVTGSGNVVSLVETAAGAFAQYQLLGSPGGTPWIFGHQSDYLSGSLVFRNVSDRMVITTGGNVGIGTSSPSQKLEVAGVIRGEAVNVYGSTDPASTSPYLFSPSLGALGFGANGSERMRITSAGVINTTSRLNVNGAGDNSLFSFINNGTTYTLGFSPNATASTSTTLTITTATTTWIYNGTGTATWTLPNPSGTNQMFWIKNAGTGVLTLNAFSGTNIINNSATAVSSITIAVGATALIQQDGNVRSYQLQ